MSYVRHFDTPEFRKIAKDVEIGYIWALVAWYDEDDDRLCLSRVHAYDFDDFCIGDCGEWTPWNRIKFNCRHDYALPYEFVTWWGERKAKLDARGLEHIEGGYGDPRSGVPFLPPYTFNVHRPEDYGLGIEQWPKGDVEVTVRCVSDLDRPPVDLKHVSFPRDIRLEIEEHDTVGSICHIICLEINKQVSEDGVRVDAQLLFEQPYVGEWRMEMWVMLQKDGPQKLFRYVSGKLTQFLSTSPMVRKKDKRLYVEAHFVVNRRRDRSQRHSFS